MLWFINPHNPKKMINLTVVASVATKKNMIYLDDHTWMFETEKQAEEVFESMVKLAQENRYRKKDNY